MDIPLQNLQWQPFVTAAHALIAEAGLRGFSLRRLAQASGWTLGEIGYRLGRKEQIFEQLIAHEVRCQQQIDAAWHARLAGITRLDASFIADLAGNWLDEQATIHRDRTIFWGEMQQARLADLAPWHTEEAHALHTEYLSSRTIFWQELLAGRHQQAEALGRLLANFLHIEQYYTLTLGHISDYRLLRNLCLHRLCHGLLADPARPDEQLFDNLSGRLSHHQSDTTTSLLTDKAREVAMVAGELLGEQGAAAVTHRAVAARAGRSVSAITHHFPTHVELVQHAYEALHLRLTDELVAGHTPKVVPAEETPASTGNEARPAYPGLGLLRANLMLLIEAARSPNYTSFIARQRARRGRYSGLWAKAYFPNKQGFDNCAAQISSITFEGEFLGMLTAGIPYAGRSPHALADFISLAAA